MIDQEILIGEVQHLGNLDCLAETKVNKFHDLEKVEIKLNGIKCDKCGQFITTEDDYLHALDHEWTEALCMMRALPIRFKSDGFDEVHAKILSRKITHICNGERYKIEFT